MKISVYGDSVLECVRLGEDGKYVRSHELVSCFEAEHNVVIENRSKFGATIERGFSRLQHDLERGGLDKAAILRWLGDLEAISRWQESYSRIAEELAKDRGCLILDLRSAFPASGDELDACLCSDGIHPDLAGQQLIYKRASESIKKLLG